MAKGNTTAGDICLSPGTVTLCPQGNLTATDVQNRISALGFEVGESTAQRRQDIRNIEYFLSDKISVEARKKRIVKECARLSSLVWDSNKMWIVGSKQAAWSHVGTRLDQLSMGYKIQYGKVIGP